MPNLPDHIDSLIERLEERIPVESPRFACPINRDGPEAAQLLSQCRDEIRRLREALEPFARGSPRPDDFIAARQALQDQPAEAWE